MKIKNFFRPLAGTALILVIPLLTRWPWGILDFVVMGLLLFLTGVIMEVVAAKVEVKYRPRRLMCWWCWLFWPFGPNWL
jgi:hypothetical protein